jgi:hypothetical protein
MSRPDNKDEQVVRGSLGFISWEVIPVLGMANLGNSGLNFNLPYIAMLSLHFSLQNSWWSIGFYALCFILNG